MKRLTETTKWADDWFQELPSKYKLLWLYLLDSCDCAGVWKVNFRLANFQIGEEFDAKESLLIMVGRVEDIGGGKWWIKRFVNFQCPTLSERSGVHRRIMQTLDSHGLSSRSGLDSGPRRKPDSGADS